MVRPIPILTPENNAPRVRLEQLDNLWFQLTGTVCNLTCKHCFISCSPSNHNFGFLDYDIVIRTLRESRNFGAKEYYFTGGEPFLHPRVLDILENTLQIGPATVLTNGTLLYDHTVRRLAEIAGGSIYSLELRISLDGPDAASHDPIRGRGTFDRTMAGVKKVVQAGFLPIITMAQTWDDAQADAIYRRMRQAMLDIGYRRPRIQMLPPIRLGAEIARSRGYREDERITPEMMQGFDPARLICSNARIVTDRGVHVCPILIGQPDSLLGQTLEQAAAADFPLQHQACYTCWLHGAICSNAPTGAGLREQTHSTEKAKNWLPV